MMLAIKLLLIALLTSVVYATSAQRDAGIAAFNSGHYSAALRDLTVAAADKSDPIAQLFLALTQAATNDCSAALPTLIQEPLNAMAGIAAVRCYSSSGDRTHEFSMLTELEQAFPNDADVLYLSARQHMKAFNDVAFNMFQRVPASYRVHQLSAEIFEVQNRFDEAISEYRKAIELNASAPDLHFRLGRALLLQSHNAEALAQASLEFKAELKLNPEDASSEFQLGQIEQVQGNTSAARVRFERALNWSPNFAQALLALGKVESAEKNYPRAIQLLARAVQLEPLNESAHYALLTAYRNSGQKEKAQSEKLILDRLQKPEDGEFSNFLKKLGEKPAQP